jgi:hypothetical protein
MLNGIITEKGLTRHLEEGVFVGKEEEDIWNMIFKNYEEGLFGFLRNSSLGFYVNLCDRKRLYRDKEKWVKTGEIYRLREGEVIGINGKDYLRVYQIMFNHKPELVIQ